MYIPHYYSNANANEVKAFIRKHNFAIIVNQVEGRPWATHIPLMLEHDKNDNDILVGHIAKSNPQWRWFHKSDEILCIFNGPHSYVSSSWYKEEEVPTWDYIAVHVYGKIRIMNEEETMQAMHRLVDAHEQGSEHPLSLQRLSPRTLRQVKGVVGFSITMDDIQAAFKLSQTRKEDHGAIIENLTKKGGMAAEIASHIKKNG